MVIILRGPEGSYDPDVLLSQSLMFTLHGSHLWTQLDSPMKILVTVLSLATLQFNDYISSCGLLHLRCVGFTWNQSNRFAASLHSTARLYCASYNSAWLDRLPHSFYTYLPSFNERPFCNPPIVGFRDSLSPNLSDSLIIGSLDLNSVMFITSLVVNIYEVPQFQLSAMLNS